MFDNLARQDSVITRVESNLAMGERSCALRRRMAVVVTLGFPQSKEQMSNPESSCASPGSDMYTGSEQ